MYVINCENLIFLVKLKVVGNTGVSIMPSEVRASHILVKTEDQIKTLLERLEKGETFEDLAKKCSLCPSGQKGGDLGYFGRGEMIKEFEDACFDTDVDDLTTVETEFGWHLIKVTGKI